LTFPVCDAAGLPNNGGLGFELTLDPEHNMLRVLHRDDVSLVTETIQEINAAGIKTTDGVQHDVDVIVYATGFRASEYLQPMTIRGRGGRTMTDLWSVDGPRAYKGCMAPGFPNFWMMYGPNTNGGLLVPSIHEVSMQLALDGLARLVLENKQAIEVKEAAYLRYNALLDERSRHKAYTDPRTRSYYWSEYGRSVTNCPFPALEMWQFLRQPDSDDYELR
jgi:4-hydroxyacetophenone monooxygenase